MASTPPSVAPNSPVRDRTTGSVNGYLMMMMRASFGDNMHLVPRALHPTAQKALLELGTAGRL